MPRVSVIMPVDRPGEDALRAIHHALAQSLHRLELILVGATPVPLRDARAKFITMEDRNPAKRRNAAASLAVGEFLAFIDDDAFAHPDWLARAVEIFETRPDVVAVGGADPGPSHAPVGEMISDLLLATPVIGSGVACHESRPEPFDVRAPHDVALVNLIVRKSAFETVGGFDESIGYIGEDTDLLRRLMIIGTVAYSPDVVVYHRRRGFPSAFIRQRWRYRVKTGELLMRGGAAGEPYRTNPKLLLLLAGAFGAALAAVFAPALFFLMAMAYVVATFLLSASKNRLPVALTPLIPLFFLVHHATYVLGICWGAFRAWRARG